MKKQLAPPPSGFTLVELVMVLILIGVVSALGVGLFAGRSAFSPLLATQQLSSSVLLAQQGGLAGNGGNALTVTQASDEFVFTISNAGVSVQEFRIAREGTSLSVSGVTFPIIFNDLGEPGIAGNAQFTFTGDSTFNACLSSLGAVYAGSCQP